MWLLAVTEPGLGSLSSEARGSRQVMDVIVLGSYKLDSVYDSSCCQQLQLMGVELGTVLPGSFLPQYQEAGNAEFHVKCPIFIS